MALPDADATTLATLASLEHRLQRLTFYLSGEAPSHPDAASDSAIDAVLSKATSNGPDATAQARLSALEFKFAKLASQSDAVKQLLDLGRQLPVEHLDFGCYYRNQKTRV